MLVQNPPVEVADRLWMLGTSAYPLYLVRGSQEGAIIEGGIGAIGPLLFRQLDQLNAGGAFVGQVVITHAHPDHVMAVPALRQKYPQIQVLASVPAAATLQAEKALAFFRQMDETLTASLARSGAIREGDRPATSAAGPMSVDRIVQEGDRIEIEDIVWDVLATPGHSECSISLYQARGGVLVISDATGYYLPQHGTWWPNYFGDYGAYVASMERLRRGRPRCCA